MPMAQSHAEVNNQAVEIVVPSCPAPEFIGLTYPRFQPFLTDEEPEDAHKERLVVGAMCKGEPVGLALYSKLYGEAERRLFSIFVTRRFRRQGIGLKLLAESERVALDTGTKKLIAFHSNQISSYRLYESLMQKAGWSEPKILEFRASGKVKWVYRAEHDWARFLARMKRGGFGTTDWTDLTDLDREQIGDLVASELPEADRVFDPLKNKWPNFLPELSVVLRSGEAIVGWVLGWKADIENTYYYSHGYVLPKYQKRGYLIAGMWEVCCRQAELFGPETFSSYETRVEAMHRVMQRMMPYTDWADERFVCEKILTDTGEMPEA